MLFSHREYILDQTNKKHGILYKSLQETNDYNAKYCDIYDTFFKQRPGEKVDYVKLILNLSQIKKRISELQNDMHTLNNEVISERKIESIIKLLETYQQLLLDAVEYFSNIIIKLQRISNNSGRYPYRIYKKDLKNLTNLENKRASTGSFLQKLSVPFMSEYRKQTKL